MATTLLFGRNGQLGWELQRSLSTIGPLVSYARQDADLERPQELREAVRRHRPKFIVNAAAYTAVDKAEENRSTALRVNHEAVAVLAEEAERIGSWLVHFSSDYVFDGRKTSAYVETDETAPLNVYGLSKAAGERAVRDVGSKHVVIRTSWLYAMHRTNFPLRILHQAVESDQLKVVADSVGTPTSASMLADITAAMLRRIGDDPAASSLSGLYHVTAAGETTWHDFAKFILAQAELQGVRLKAGANSIVEGRRADYGGAARPENSRLDTTLLREKFGIHLPEWTVGAAHFVESLVRSKLL